MYNVAVIVGSLRKDSMNKKLARALMNVGKGQMNFTLVNISDIPLYNQDTEDPPPPPVARVKETVKAADGVIFVTPEYNRSIPGVLKNVIDWCSRPYGQNVWAGKPAAIAGMSPGAVGTAVAQSHLRSILTMLGMILLSQPEIYMSDRPGVIAEDGTVSAQQTETFLRDFLTRFGGWIDSPK